MSKYKQLKTVLAGLLNFEDRSNVVSPENASWIIERLLWHKLMPLSAALQSSKTERCALLNRQFRQISLENLFKEHQYRQQLEERLDKYRYGDRAP